jgi:hypothetical protein
MKKTLIGFSLFTALGITLYWLLVFTGIFPVEELVPGYKNWFMSFPVADLWIAIAALIAGIALLKEKEIAIPFGIACGSSLIFLGLYAFLYGINTGLLFILTLDEIIEIAIKIYCLSVGSLFIVNFWKLRAEFVSHK